MKKTTVYNLPVIIEKDEDGFYVAECPVFSGCYTQGKTYEEAVRNTREVIELCLEEAKHNLAYRAKIDLGATSSDKFLGVTNIPVRVTF